MIAEIGILNILNQMKNPLTNIRLCVEMIENDHTEKDSCEYNRIIKKNAIALEDSIRDILKTFTEMGGSIYMEEGLTIDGSFPDMETKTA